MLPTAENSEPLTTQNGTSSRWVRAWRRVALHNYRSYNSQVKVRWTQASRKHRIGRAHALHVMRTVVPTATTASSGNEALLWTGPDDRGVELEVVAVVLPEVHLVIHVMPTALRRK